jgi:hypothetical protein
MASPDATRSLAVFSGGSLCECAALAQDVAGLPASGAW